MYSKNVITLSLSKFHIQVKLGQQNEYCLYILYWVLWVDIYSVWLYIIYLPTYNLLEEHLRE